MDRYLLDTHAALWFFNGDNTLPETVRRIIEGDSGYVYMSVASAWETAIKIGLGKLGFPGNSAGFVRSAQANGIIILPIETDHLAALERLPWIHRDPFDRLLIAVAQTERMTLLTADENIARYDVPYIW
jgi:PIN domain nuclease of toxin-antitoxin system